MEAPSLRNKPLFKIKIYHLPTGEDVSFEGWITEFSDDYQSSWNSESVYGRMDPLVRFQNTVRKISLGFDVVTDGRASAPNNLIDINKLITFLYPVYAEDSRSVQNTLKAPPLLGLKWTNLISNAQTGEYLVGHMDGLRYSPEMDQGGFVYTSQTEMKSITSIENRSSFVAGGANETESVRVTNELPSPAISNTINNRTPGVGTVEFNVNSRKGPIYIPKRVNISFNFTVLHNHLTGWYRDGKNFVFGNKDVNRKFPNSHYAGSRTETTTTKYETNPDNEDLVEVSKDKSVVLSLETEILEGT